MVLTGDALLVGDAGRPDLHAHGEQTPRQMAGQLYHSLTERLLVLPDRHAALPGALLRLGLRPRALRAPGSTIGFERRHNKALQFDSEDEFVEALVKDIPPAPPQQAEIIAANRSGRPLAIDALTAWLRRTVGEPPEMKPSPRSCGWSRHRFASAASRSGGE